MHRNGHAARAERRSHPGGAGAFSPEIAYHARQGNETERKLMSEMTTSQIKSKRILYLTLSTITLLFLGLIYAFSMFAAPMCKTFELEKTAVGLTFNIMMITFCVGAVIGSQIEKKLGVKGSILVAAVMFAVGFIGTGLFAHSNVGALYLFYGIICGLGVGIGYNTVIATTNVWFPDKVGLSSGVLMMGFGLGSLTLGTLSVNLAASFGLETVLIVVGIISAIVIGAEGLIISRPPANIVELMAPEQASSSGYDPGDEDKALKTPLFYVYWVWATIVIAIGLATIGNCSSDAQSVGWDAGFATLLVGLVSALNGVGRVIVGMIYDKTNVKVTMVIDGLVGVVAAVSIIAAFTMNVPVLYVIGAFCCGFCYGGVPVVASAFGRQRFGAKNYPLNLSLCNFAIVWGSILNVILQAILGTDMRVATFTVLAVMAVIAVLDAALPFAKMFERDKKMLAERKAAHEGK